MKRDFLTFQDVSEGELRLLIRRAIQLKKLTRARRAPQILKGRVMCLVFEKSSTRTRVSFEVGMRHLGGSSLYLNQDMSQLGRGETYADTARVLSRYVDVIIMRTFSHTILQELAQHASIPVINGLSDSYHPCQVLADLVTMTEKKMNIDKSVVSWVGDGNNMAHSWIEAAALLGFELRIACPKGFAVDEKIRNAHAACSRISYTSDPVQAVTGSDAVNADTWFSMGQEVSEKKRAAFAPFQLNAKLMAHAKSSAIVMHCLPAHRGEEITDAVMDGAQSVVFDQAENRLFAQMAVLELLFAKKRIVKKKSK
jgi:ornithine carbamoyltransferase